MIIKYATHGDKYSAFLRIPDALPWKMVVELTSFDEGAVDAGENDYVCSYEVKLIVGNNVMEETIIDGDFCEIPGRYKVESRDDEIRDFLNYVVEEAASSLAFAERNGDRVFDLGKTISICEEEWLHQLQLAEKEADAEIAEKENNDIL